MAILPQFSRSQSYFEYHDIWILMAEYSWNSFMADYFH